ncbi:transposase [Streptomyces sp. NPDC094461]|uniref:transposase n=1 Tax=Streptomyces sp. NPDC094461 TaxID=3366064 RepID=UPI0037FBE9D2
MLEPLLPQGEKSGRPPVRTRRQLIDGIRFRVRTGTPWRDVPEEHGPWDRAYDLFRRQRRNGTWQRIFTGLQAHGRREGPDRLGPRRRLHHRPCPPAHRRGPKRGDLQEEPPGGITTEPTDHGLGRSRGGLTTKLHLAVERRQKPMSIVITAGRRGIPRGSRSSASKDTGP